MIETILFIYFAINTLYVFILSVAGWAYKMKPIPTAKNYKKIAVLVPAYKEDAVIVHSVKHLLKLNYPAESFDVIVIADRLKEETMQQLRSLRVVLIPILFKKTNKSKSMNYALSQLPEDKYDIVVVSDADNVPSWNFLRNVNSAFQAGHPIIQAQRVAKNTDTPVAILDAISETINNHLFRQGVAALGLSPSLIGSAMAFEYKLFKEELAKVDAVSEDKELQLAFMEKKHKVLYLKGTLVYDEKVSSAEAYKNQRRRWFAGHFNQLRYYFGSGIRHLLKGNVDYFHLSVWYNLFPPRVLTLSALFTFSILFPILYPGEAEIVMRWWTMTLVFIAALLIAIPQSFYKRELFMAIATIPLIVLKTFQAMLQLRNADKQFIHTKHKATEVDTTLYP